MRVPSATADWTGSACFYAKVEARHSDSEHAYAEQSIARSLPG